jgi:cytochrome c oxidase assembly protein subunit 15
MLGILNVMLLAPVWLQIVHLLVAELFWVLVVLASATLVFFPADSHSGVRSVGSSLQDPSKSLVSVLRRTV